MWTKGRRGRQRGLEEEEQRKPGGTKLDKYEQGR